ncbi:MAG TPA: peptide ABC transporter substrate-binding protein [Dehalococcoidia bacterium]|nr:peptide ABC transporter substrate-binding protein [Dehalococcoidia bacterium]
MNKTILGLFGVIAALVIVLGVLAIVILGGGGDDGGGGSTQGGDPLNPNRGGAQAAAGDLRLLGADPITLDPALAGDAGSATYIVEIFGGLVTLDRDLKVVPDIAERWEVSPDGRTYTFFLRRNALFHDGRPVTADDFKYSIERTANPRTASTTAEAYLGDIVGARDMIRGRAQSISGVQVVDSLTLRITIDEPKPYFLAKLTYPTAFVVDKNQVEANPRNWTRRPNGTGPYKLQEWRLNERIILTANDKYHLGAPSVKRVLFNLAGGSALTQFENNEIDVAGISINDIERVRSPRDKLNPLYRTAPSLSIDYIGFNTKTAPFDDPKVRQAFALAIDREQIAKVLFKDMVPVANGFLPAGSPGYNPNSKGPEYNPERARQLLQESKYAGRLPPITFTEAGAGATAGLDTQAIIEMWKQNLGVEVRIAQTEVAAFFDDLDRGNLQLFSSGWIMDYPDPENVLDLLFHSRSRQNNTRYENPEYDALVERARTEQNVERRLALYREAEQILLRDLPWVPLTFGVQHFVVQPHVKGYDPRAMIIPRLRFVTIER